MRKLFFLLISTGVLGGPQVLQPVKAQGATTAVIEAFANHDIVMLAEWHADKQEHEWLRQLVSTPAFADRVDDIVMEIGNSLYQKSVDRYVSGENVSFEKVEKAWRNTVGSVGAPSPVYGLLYKTVREVNLSRPGKHQIRIVCGDPYINWQKVRTLDDVGPYLGNRDKWYAQVVKTEVLAKKHHALLIAGGAHFLRWNGPGYIERELRAAGANPYVVAFGTNAVGGYDDLDNRFDSWPLPAIVSLASNWVGDLPAMPVLFGGTVGPSPLKLGQVADALLYVGQRDSLQHTFMTRSELQGTAYGKEIARRQEIQFGKPLKLEEQPERPEFERPSSDKTEGVPVPSPIPRTIGDPLPPKPRFQ